MVADNRYLVDFRRAFLRALWSGFGITDMAVVVLIVLAYAGTYFVDIYLEQHPPGSLIAALVVIFIGYEFLRAANRLYAGERARREQLQQQLALQLMPEEPDVVSTTIQAGRGTAPAVHGATDTGPFTERALTYLQNIDALEGWLDRSDGLGILECLRIQRNEGIKGDIAEIGVHHGKSFMLLTFGARPEETLYAIDLFEQQHLNVDRSGCGNRETFLANVARFSPEAKVKAIAMSSTLLRGAEKPFEGPLRFLSIDGGHTKALTYNDLEVANEVLADDGMCCLDDVLNPHWTGVISGLFVFMGVSNTLVPFALFPNKIFMCRPHYQKLRQEQFRDVFAPALAYKDKEFGPHKIDVYGDCWTALGCGSETKN